MGTNEFTVDHQKHSDEYFVKLSILIRNNKQKIFKLKKNNFDSAMSMTPRSVRIMKNTGCKRRKLKRTLEGKKAQNMINM